mmetsp:Transcript_132123/g.263662  ORF Transcript_132123/g.263662 Transcript_132123/m.263662 type:complete len:96 (-) Transcript_132123:104-391(-)
MITAWPVAAIATVRPRLDTAAFWVGPLQEERRLTLTPATAAPRIPHTAVAAVDLDVAFGAVAESEPRKLEICTFASGSGFVTGATNAEPSVDSPT